MMKKLFSICIPTFNRANYLDVCLKSIVTQLDDNLSSKIEIIVIDNNSSDDTESIVRKYLHIYPNINYTKNSENIGLDGNLTKAFDLASGKYVQIIGDDDYWITDKLKKAIDLMEKNDFGVLYARAFAFNNINDPMPTSFSANTRFYQDCNLFLYNINILITFTSSSIINKDIVLKSNDFELNRFLGTELNLLNWVYSACLDSHYNIITDEYYIAAKTDNSSGYKLFQVFGIHFNSIMSFFKSKGLSKSVIQKVNFELTTSFFPNYINKSKKNDFSYNDASDEISLFLKGYRNRDFLSKIFLVQEKNKTEGLTILLTKKLIVLYATIITKSKNLIGMIDGSVYKKKIVKND